MPNPALGIELCRIQAIQVVKLERERELNSLLAQIRTLKDLSRDVPQLLLDDLSEAYDAVYDRKPLNVPEPPPPADIRETNSWFDRLFFWGTNGSKNGSKRS